MIRSFHHKGLRHFFETGSMAGIRPEHAGRLRLQLGRLDSARVPEDMNLPGFDFHPLHGFKPTRYSLHVNGPWCITFEWAEGDALRVDLEQYH